MREINEFLNDTYRLNALPEVRKSLERQGGIFKKKVHMPPSEVTQIFLDRFEEILSNPNQKGKNGMIQALKQKILTAFVIAPDNIPETYWNLQKKILRERGQGVEEIPEEIKVQEIERIIAEQTASLEEWIDYLSSPDARYEMGLKYWALRSIVWLQNFDKEKGTFLKRATHTVAPFPELNREALSYAFEFILAKITENTISMPHDEVDEAVFNQIIKKSNFADIYAFAIREVTRSSSELLHDTRGTWVKYPQESDHLPLVKSIRGKATGWCTVGEGTAKEQLEGGDFYVYYSLNEKGKATIPRVAIRMEGYDIAEIRGIGKNQNIDQYIVPVLEEKLHEFGNQGETYRKKMSDMGLLTEIDKKSSVGEMLSREELIFLYEIENRIDGFGYRNDPRIDELRGRRDSCSDLNTIFEGIDYYEKDLNISGLKSAKGLKLPREMKGNIKFPGLSNAEGLVLPEKFHGNLYLDGITSAVGLNLPYEEMYGLSLNGLTSAAGLRFPRRFINQNTFQGGLSLDGLTTAVGLELPEEVLGSVSLRYLPSAEGLVIPETITGEICLRGLKTGARLKIPENFRGTIDLSGLESVEGLELPERFMGSLNLGELTSIKGLKFPKYMGGNLNLRSLGTTEGMELPKYLGGDLDLSSLQSAIGLILPDEIGGNVDLRKLHSSEGLKLPDSMKGGLILVGLKSAVGLVLPKHIGGDLNLDPRSAVGLTLPESIGGTLDLGSLTSAEGLVLPKETLGGLSAWLLNSAQGLKFPAKIPGKLDLSNLKTLEGLNFPDEVGKLKLRLKSVEGIKFPKITDGDFDLVGPENMVGFTLPEDFSGALRLFMLPSAKGLKIDNRIRKVDFGTLRDIEGLEISSDYNGEFRLGPGSESLGAKLQQKCPLIKLSYYSMR